MRIIIFSAALLAIIAACTEQSRPLADKDIAAVDGDTVAVVDNDQSDQSDQSDQTDQTDQSDELSSDDEGGDELLSDSDTPVVCTDVALNDCAATPECVLSELPIVSNFGSCYTEMVPVACMAESEKNCPPDQWADPEYVYDPATGRCFLFYTGCFPASWQYTVGTYPTECAGGVAPITLPPCDTSCDGLDQAACSQTNGCVLLNSQRLRLAGTDGEQTTCIEANEWVGCFANSELACRDSAFYPVVDLNGDCWISNGCEPLWWQYPSMGDHCWIDGSGGSQIAPCSARW